MSKPPIESIRRAFGAGIAGGGRLHTRPRLATWSGIAVLWLASACGAETVDTDDVQLQSQSEALLAKPVGKVQLQSRPAPGKMDRSTHSQNAIYRDGYVYLLSERRVLAPEEIRAVLGGSTFDPGEGWPTQTGTNESMQEVARVAQEMVNEASAGGSLDEVVNPAALKGRAL